MSRRAPSAQRPAASDTPNAPARPTAPTAPPRRPPLVPALARAALACVLALAALATPAFAQTSVPSDWSLKPTGLTTGDEFRLLFLSSTKRNGSAQFLRWSKGAHRRGGGARDAPPDSFHGAGARQAASRARLEVDPNGVGETNASTACQKNAAGRPTGKRLPPPHRGTRGRVVVTRAPDRAAGPGRDTGRDNVRDDSRKSVTADGQPHRRAAARAAKRGGGRFRRLAAALLVAIAASALATQAAAQTVTTFISNTGQTSNAAAATVRATAFTTGTGTYTLSSVGILILSAGSVGTPVVQIYGDTSGNPGTLAATMTNPGTITTAVNTFTAPANTTLSASTTYWLVTSNSAATDGTGFQVGLIGNTNLDSGTAAGWSIGNARFKSDIANTSWSTSQQRHRFEIRGTGGTTTNNPPTVANAIPDQTATAGTAFSYAFPDNGVVRRRLGGVPSATFSDADSDTLTYAATKADDTALPTWLSFTDSTRTFSGTPQAADIATVSVKVTASDGNGGSVSDEFDITVSAAADTTPPTLTSGAVVPGGTHIVLLFSENLQTANVTSEFTVTADGSAVRVTHVARVNSNHAHFSLTVSPLIRQGQAVVVTYTDPSTGNDTNAIQDAAGNDAATFTTGMNSVPAVTNGSTVVPIAPGAPTGLTATASGTTTINLSWTAPADNGGRVITGYKIEVSSDSGATWTDRVANTSSTTTTYAHTGLAAGATRHYRVSAINTIGTGLPSNIDNATTTNNAPTVANAIPDQSAPVGTAFSYAFPANTFSDADSDALTYTATKADATALPTWLSFTASTRAFSGTPQAADTGTVSVKVTASDGNGGSVSDEFDITVSAAADTTPPTLTRATILVGGQIIELQLSENVQRSNLPLVSAFTVTAGGSAVTLSLVLVPAALDTYWISVPSSSVIRQGQVVVVTYTDPTTGDDVRAIQDVAGNDAATFTTGMNSVPAVTNNSTVNTPATGAPTITGTPQVGQTLMAVTTAIMDANGLTTVSYTYQWIRVDGATETNISLATASTYTLVAADQGKTIKVKVSFTDDASHPETRTSAATAAVTAAANSAPTVANDIPDQTVTAGMMLTYNFPANTFSDTDGDTLTYTATKADGTALPSWLSFTGDTRTFAGTPEAGDVGTVTVKVTASDGNGGSVSDEFDILVSSAANNAATGAPTITGTAQVGQTLTAVTTAVMDADGLTSVSYAYQWIRVNGTDADISGAMSSTYTLVAADQGKTITVKVSFTDDASNPETLTSAATAAVTAAPVTDPDPEPEEVTVLAVDDAAETAEDTPVTIDVLANDSDPDGDTLTVVEVSAPTHGTAVVADTGAVVYTPEPDFHGTDRFTYVVGDGSGLTARAAVEVTVLPVNDPPLAGDDAAETAEDTSVTIAVLRNDSDGDGDALALVEASAPAHGSARLTDAGAVEYTPEPDFHGTDRFTYVVGDGSGLTAQAAVEVTVLPVNDPPLATGVIPDQTLDVGDGPAVLDLIPFFADRDGDALGYTAVVSDQAVAVRLTGATLTLTVARPGAAMVTVTAQDPGGLTATQAFMVTMTDRQARGVIEDTLAALGRGHLASARATLGRRVETTGQEPSHVTVAGLHVPLGAGARGVAAAGQAVAERWITGLAGGMPLQTGSWAGTDAVGAPGSPAATLGMGRQRAIRGGRPSAAGPLRRVAGWRRRADRLSADARQRAGWRWRGAGAALDGLGAIGPAVVRRRAVADGAL